RRACSNTHARPFEARARRPRPAAPPGVGRRPVAVRGRQEGARPSRREVGLSGRIGGRREGLAMATSNTSARTTRYTEAEAADRLSFAEAALGAAGHEVTDPVLKDLLAQQARGEISGDEARERSRRHILGR